MSSALVGLVNSTNGKRTWGDISPSRLSAYLNGEGLVSLNSTAVSFSIGTAQRCAGRLTPLRRYRPIAPMALSMPLIGKLKLIACPLTA